MKMEIEGNHAAIVFQTGLDEKYHRKNLCLKVFKAPVLPEMEMKDVTWSERGGMGFRENLLECTKIQNLLAFQGLAPRVYDLIFITFNGEKHAAQVTDFIPHKDFFPDVTFDVMKYCMEVGIKPHDIGGGANIRNGLFTDFQEFEFGDYEEGLIQRLISGLAYAGTKNKSYQSVEELGIKGERINKEREKLLQIPEGISTVLDFGCNGAYFMRRAFDAGAIYGVGVDVPRVNEAARELNNYLGYFNMDFMDKVPDQEFDLVLLLSAFGYAKVEEIFPKAKMALIEGHCLNGQHTEDYYEGLLAPYYSNITTLGWIKDDPENPPRVVMKGENAKK